MTDHKFEPFQRVLVRDSDYKLWRADFFSHNDGDREFPFCCVRDDWRQCIPYTPETAHLLGTAQPYEQPKPPVEYEWGQKVEVYEDGAWHEALYIYKSDQFNDHWCSRKDQMLRMTDYKEEAVRPLPDTAAQ